MTILRDKGGFLSPVIQLVSHDGVQALLKDFRSRNPVTRGLIGPMLVRREHDILKRLEGIPGIPRALAIVGDGKALLMEYIPGQTLGKFKPCDLADDIFHRIEATLAAIHKRGIVHLDLRQKKNVLIADADRRPYIIDFANAARVDGASPLRILAGKLRGIDHSGLLKFKARHFPHLLTDKDRQVLKKHAKFRKFWVFSPHTVRERDVVW